MFEDNRIQAESHYYAALDYFGQERYEEAIEQFRRALAIDPAFADAMHGLARVLQDLERYDEAIDCIRRLQLLGTRVLGAVVCSARRRRGRANVANGSFATG